MEIERENEGNFSISSPANPPELIALTSTGNYRTFKKSESDEWSERERLKEWSSHFRLIFVFNCVNLCMRSIVWHSVLQLAFGFLCVESVHTRERDVMRMKKKVSQRLHRVEREDWIFKWNAKFTNFSSPCCSTFDQREKSDLEKSVQQLSRWVFLFGPFPTSSDRLRVWALFSTSMNYWFGSLPISWFTLHSKTFLAKIERETPRSEFLWHSLDFCVAEIYFFGSFVWRYVVVSSTQQR